MKRGFFYWLLLSAVLGFAGCKKQIEQVKADALADYLAANKWMVQSYTEGGVDVTAEFQDYEFLFNKDYTLTGTKISSDTRYTGTWQSNVGALTMTAQFAAGTPRPVSLINGTWGISSYNSTATIFGQTVNGVDMRLIFRKKP